MHCHAWNVILCHFFILLFRKDTHDNAFCRVNGEHFLFFIFPLSLILFGLNLCGRQGDLCKIWKYAATSCLALVQQITHLYSPSTTHFCLYALPSYIIFAIIVFVFFHFASYISIPVLYLGSIPFIPSLSSKLPVIFSIRAVTAHNS